MSSSSPSSSILARVFASSTMAGACWLVLAPVCPAAEWYLQPMGSLSASYNTNVELTPVASDKVNSQGYFADAASVIGILTPTSQTTIRPDVRYEYFPQDSGLNRLEAFLDLNSQATFQRDRLSVVGRFDRRDDLNAEAPEAQFNPVTPGVPITPSTGHVNVGVVRDNLYVTPTYEHNLTPLSGLGMGATLQHLTYSPDIPQDFVNFNYYQANPYYFWKYSQRMDVQVGLIGSRYDALNIDSKTTAYGTQVGVRYDWSPIWRTDFEGLYQRTDINQQTPTVFRDKTNNWGLTVATTYLGQINQLRFNAGRSILPSSGGALFNTDQVQAQYDHEFTERLKTTAAVLYQRTGALVSNFTVNTRSYTTTQLFVRYMLTQVFYIRGGYAFAWQKYTNDPNSASGNQISVQVGYIGLGGQR